MGNQWNNFFNQLFTTGANIFKGVQEGNAKDDALTVYRTAMENIKKSITPAPVTESSSTEEDPSLRSGQEQDQNPTEFVSKLFQGFNPEAGFEQNIQNMQPAGFDVNAPIPGMQKQTPSNLPLTKGETTSSDPFDVYWQGINDLLAKGKYGEQYIPLLSTYYEGTKPVKSKIKTEISNGFLLQYDEGGNIIKKTKIDDTPKELKNTIEKYQGMSYEDALKLTDNELSGDAFYYLPKEVQTKLMETFPALQQMHDAKFKEEGDFAPKTGFKKSGFKQGKMNFADDRIKDLGEQLYRTKKRIEGLGGLEKADEETQKIYNGILAELEANGISDPESWSNDIASGKKFNDAMETQKEFTEDFNTIVNDKGGIYDWLMQMYNIDTSKTGAVELLQKNRFELEKYVNELSKQLDYQLAMKIYKYVNTEMGKLYQSKGLGEYYR
jgi:hypothetical protein